MQNSFGQYLKQNKYKVLYLFMVSLNLSRYWGQVSFRFSSKTPRAITRQNYVDRTLIKSKVGLLESHHIICRHFS